ncbi:MAG: ribose-phosphate diphosphokinase [Vallitaleaceae bacterium]|nr:ribose-phosphate diphosphokinase [Vallitaleaceae bacterium]
MERIEKLDTAPAIGLIALKGTEKWVDGIAYYLKQIYEMKDIQVINLNLPRFSTGDAKGVLNETVRGMDVFILVDVGNYDCEYAMFNRKSFMSPDEHFQDLKRTISAIGGKADRITVIMPMLYAARQDRRLLRESLDCAVALRELENMGVKNIMSFDVHDDRVSNAVPFVSFDNLMPTYQVIKALNRDFPEVVTEKNQLVVVSPDVGATNRNILYSTELDTEMGLFYKRRSRDVMVDGQYPITVHKYIGPDVKGKDVFIYDDIIASGGTMLDVMKKMKDMGARKVFVAVTFGLFTEGVEKFNRAYEEGLFDAIFSTNATYRSPELLNEPWYKEVDLTKYMAYYVYCINQGKSISQILNPHVKIHELIDHSREGQ